MTVYVSDNFKNASSPDGLTEKKPVITVRGLNVWYGNKQAIRDISFDIFPNETLAFIGPSGCGKSTALMAVNRMVETKDKVRVEGDIRLNGQDIYHPSIDPIQHRRKIGTVFQTAVLFPQLSILDNVLYPIKIHGLAKNKAERLEKAEHALRKAALWDEVFTRLDGDPGALSGGQQQRLCIARAIAGEPDVLLMDEPCSALDQIAMSQIEDLIEDLRSDTPVVIVTHNLQQAARISQRVAYFDLSAPDAPGHLDTYGPTGSIFTKPPTPRSEGYVTGRFG